MDHAEAIRENGWKQGAVLLPESMPQQCEPEPKLRPGNPGSIFIVLSQDCDVVQRSFEKEPHVELIRATPVEGSENGILLYGKNPRLIQIPIGESYFECSCEDRFRIPRICLSACKPSEDHILSEIVVGLLREWVAKRYVRPAFPDNFNSRVNSGSEGKAVVKILKQTGYLFEDIYLFCDPSEQELSSDSDYKIIVWPTMSNEDYEISFKRIEAVKACTKLEAALANCPGIVVNECELRHEGQVTIDDLHYFKPWDFDYLTFRENINS